MDKLVAFAREQQRPLTLFALAALAYAAVQRRATLAAAGAARRAFTCDGNGGDCPCHAQETSRPPATPKTDGPVKLTLAPGETKYLCTCGESKNYVSLAARGCVPRLRRSTLTRIRAAVHVARPVRSRSATALTASRARRPRRSV